ncbi:MAG: hypothetical protein ACLFUE_07690 [Desulfobacteraceae bacterium]
MTYPEVWQRVRDGQAGGEPPKKDRLLNIRQVSDRLGCSRSNIYNLINQGRLSAVTAGLARGKVLGGNLSILTHLAGTPYMPDLEGAVLFLEETGEPLYRVDRMITHLALSGVFRGLAGLLIGDFIGCGDPYAVQDLLMEHVGPLEIPVMAGFPVGHGRVNRLVPMGLEATVDTAAMQVIWHESCLSDSETVA